ncbi:MAG TPA: hypothetical protein VK845_11620 [Gemmatimonadales bacterium]|nr:hypothetical protein [Gemmatimonadales bacterium]
MATESISWAVIIALGVWHGINPGMGWLFAVALGMQEGSGRAVWRALPPLALGHALAIAGAVGVALALGSIVSVDALQWGVAAVLVVFGLDRLRRSRHPRYGGMRMQNGELVVWSALMASAHGAGLMVIPFVVRHRPDASMAQINQVSHAGMSMMLGAHDAILATLLHTGGYLLVACLMALIVYRWVGVRVLRKVWLNLDLVWGVVLVVTGVVTPML